MVVLVDLAVAVQGLALGAPLVLAAEHLVLMEQLEN
jgi:hypothetical protein